MKRASLWIAMAVTLSCGAPVRAQLAPGYSGTSSAPIEAAEREYWFLIRQMGSCAVTNKRADAEAFLATAPGSVAETRVFRKMFGAQRNVCMQNFVSATVVRAHLRGAIAESLYKTLAHKSPSPPPAEESPAKAEMAIANLNDFARCYVGSNPVEARTLLSQTRLGTEEEYEMVSRMAPGFKSCLPAGRKITLDALDVRLSLAEALYHQLANSSASQVVN